MPQLEAKTYGLHKRKDRSNLPRVGDTGDNA